MKFRIATFNVENLFNRYAFLDGPWNGRTYERYVVATGVASIANRQGELVTEATTVIQRNNTARAIGDLGADVVAVQEIENVYTLRNFNHDYLDDYFDHCISMDGNDPRAIDVGLMVRKSEAIRVVGMRSNVDFPEDPSKPIIRDSRANGYFATNVVFSRDCLEIDVDVNGVPITLLINHFKAQDGDEKPGGKGKATLRRKRQAKEVAGIVERVRESGRRPIVLGDLNIDTRQANYDGSLDPLFAKGLKLQDPLRDLIADPAEQWTHYYDSDKTVSRLDYVLVDAGLQVTDCAILRAGLTTKCRQSTVPRYPTIGPMHSEASDHCPLVIELEV